MNSLVNLQYCYDYLVEQISLGLLLYSHIPTGVIALVFGSLLLYKTRKLSSVTLFVVCLSFALWCFFNLGAWFAFLGAEITMFTWSLVDLTSLIFFSFSYYFLYVFLKKKDLPLWQKLSGIALILPTAYWTFLGKNLTAFDVNICEAWENDFVTSYPVYVQMVFLGATIILAAANYFQVKNEEEKKKTVLAGLGIVTFLFFFFFSNFLADYFIQYNIWQYAYNVEIYGLFGMPILLIYLGYLIVKYHAFDLRIFTAQALVISTLAIVIAQYAFLHEPATIILNTINFVLVLIVGTYLSKDVRKEIEAHKQIEKLANKLAETTERLYVTNEHLEELNRQKTEFVSIASHQLRSPLTAIKGYASMMLEGSFGQLGDQTREATSRIFESSQKLVNVIEDFLNVTRIELGKMKYEMADFDLKQLAETVINELKPTIERKGIAFSFSAEPGTYTINGDQGKISQVLSNLIDNSLKYTPKGSVAVSVERTGEKIRFKVKDTGIGIAPETLPKLFEKFIRADEAGQTNIKGTGLGLYVAKQIMEGHNGRLWAESEGEGKGATFYAEFREKK
ncbi:MAG TPA: HAMP domain-containing sensor histidine kinase [Candidatus Paceibacterota bacterium]|nr:HAMP domain-containing sensor histidine kinase [Candidatus Paceibacterota bacterium]